jgi:hypothetical protein
MLDHWLHYIKAYAVDMAKSSDTNWFLCDVGASSLHDESPCDTAPLRLLEDAPPKFSEVTSSMETLDQIGIKRDPVENNIPPSNDHNALATQLSSTGDTIELNDLDDLEEYLYEDASPELVEPGPEPGDTFQFPDAMWKVSYSVDSVMRPIQAMFAPESAYQAMDGGLSKMETREDAIEDNRELVKSIVQVLGRFATRQGDLTLLRKAHQFCPWDQDEEERFIKTAVECKQVQCFEYLLPSVDDKEIQARILELCAYHNQVEMIQKAFDSWTKFVKSEAANVPLVVAASHGHVDVVRFLLMKCTDVEMSIASPYVDEDYPTPVLAAAAGGHFAILQELAAAGAKIRQKPDSKEPEPFSKALAAKNAPMLACLIKYDHSLVDGKSALIRNILDIALECDNAELIDLTLSQDESETFGPYESYLRSASQRGQLEIMHTLISHHAYSADLLPNQRDSESYSHRCAHFGHPWRHSLIVALLREHCSPRWSAPNGLLVPNGSSTISDLAWMGDVTGLTMLFDDEPEVEVNVVDKCGNSPLFDAMYNHLQCKEGYLKGQPGQWLKTIRILLAHGAKLNMKDGQYWADHYGGVPKEILADLRDFAAKEKHSS